MAFETVQVAFCSNGQPYGLGWDVRIVFLLFFFKVKDTLFSIYKHLELRLEALTVQSSKLLLKLFCQDDYNMNKNKVQSFQDCVCAVFLPGR